MSDIQSRLADLRARHEQAQAEEHIDVPIPGYDDELVARYGIIPWSKSRELGKKAAVGPDYDERELDIWCDELIAACQGFYLKDDGKLEPLDPDQAVRYDVRLAEKLGLDPGSPPAARRILRGLFELPLKDKGRAPYRISLHHDRVLAFTLGGGPDDNGAVGRASEAFAGE